MASKIETVAALPATVLRSDPADRGKSAEKQLRTQLTRLAGYAGYAYHRFPDARAGSRVEAPADYMLLAKGKLIFMEVKEVAHEYRLPHGNFDTGQAARMRLLALAGATAVVLVRHSTTAIWRLIDLPYLQTREGGSWNLSGFPERELADILKELICTQ